MKHIKLFEEFASKVDEAYDGNLSDFRYEFPLHFENATGNDPSAIKKIEKKGKGYEVRTSTYMSEPEMKAVGDEMGLKLVSYKKDTSVAVTVYESVEVNEDVEYSVNDFPIGADVSMGDEVWKVVKPGTRGEKIFMVPFNAEAKRKYISMAIEFDLNWLNANITNISK